MAKKIDNEKIDKGHSNVKVTWQIDNDSFIIKLKFKAGDLVVNKNTSVLMKVESLAAINYEAGHFRYVPEYECTNVLSQFPRHNNAFKEHDLVLLSEAVGGCWKE